MVPYEWTPDEMLEVKLSEPDDFLVVKETLTRIGAPSFKDDKQKLIQSCHILHKQGLYFITHFKELFLLDGRTSSLTQEDIMRRNTIALLLSDWGLVDLVKSLDDKPKAPIASIKVIKASEKSDWILESKYTIGK